MLTPDAAAVEYQQMLLAAARAAGDDPALVQAATPAVLRELLASADAGRPAAAGEWTAHQVAGHIVQAELVWSTRYRWALAEVEPPVPGYDQDLWVQNLLPLEADPEAMLRLFTALREANIALWHAASQAHRARTVLHGERGPESYDTMFRLITGHDQVHLAQMRATLAASRAG